MKAFWTPKDKDECDPLEADVTTCLMVGNSINILFSGVHDGDSFEGRLSLLATSEIQTVVGTWIYPDKKREAPRFSEKDRESEETIYQARVVGKLNNFRKTQVLFEGVWDDSVWDKDGCIYAFEIEAKIA